jgi:hypothetical protein
MSPIEIIREISKGGVWIGLDGDDLAIRARTNPPNELLAKIKANKAALVAMLRQAARAVRPMGYSDEEWLAAVGDAKRLVYPCEKMH